MSIALYRRYRPERFADLIGQDVVAQTLRNEVSAGSLAHAYLFAGMRGTGKTSTARILARAVNCLSLQNGEPCNQCSACREILGGGSVDVLEIDAASNRGIDEMRDLRDKVKYMPAGLQRKVYIIDEAHMLTPEAWNAFLKTLEEPPEHVLFVLATTEPHKVPETVRSRVQRFDFRRIATTELAAHLATVAEREGVTAEDGALQLLARAAQGSVRDGLSLLDQAVSAGGTPVTLAGARRALGLADPATMHELMRALSGADAAAALRALASAFAAGADPRQLLREVARLARAAELTALGYPEGAEVTPEEAALCADLAAVAPPGFWLSGLDLFAEAETNLRQPVDARLQVELCLLRLLRPSRSTPDEAAVAALAVRVGALERAAKSPATPPPAPVADGEPIAASAVEAEVVAQAAQVRDGDLTLERWRSEWPVVIEAVTRVDSMLAGVLRDCRPVEASTGHLVIGTQHKFHIDKVSDPAKTAVVAEAASQVAGHPVTVETRFTASTQPAEQSAPGTVSEATRAVLQTFAGSRVVATRLRDDADPAPPSRRGA